MLTRRLVHLQEKAALHFERAAKAGDPTAAGSMGQMYSHGVGVPQNNETALRYFRQGELSGDAASLNGLGYLYLYGMGVERSIDRAAKYFHKAAHEKGKPAERRRQWFRCDRCCCPDSWTRTAQAVMG